MNILLSVITTLGILIAGFNLVSFDQTKYLSKEYWLKSSKLGAFTTLSSSDQLSAFPTTYNANLAKTVEIGTTTIPTITSLPALVTVGTVTAGAWQANTLQSLYGGTGTTSMSKFRVVLGNGTASTTVATSTGSVGMFLTSAGEGAFPFWQTSSVNLGDNYSWTGLHRWSQPMNASSSLLVANQLSVSTSTPSLTANLLVNGGALISGSTTLSTLTVASSTLSINGLTYQTPSTQSTNGGLATTSLLVNDGQGTLTWGIPVSSGATSTNPGNTQAMIISHGLGRVPSIIKINTTAIIREGDNSTNNLSWSVGTATSTASNSHNSIGNGIDGGTAAYNTIKSASTIVQLNASDATARVVGSITAMTSTTFTLTLSTNANSNGDETEAINGIRFLWEVQ